MDDFITPFQTDSKGIYKLKLVQQTAADINNISLNYNQISAAVCRISFPSASVWKECRHMIVI